MPKTLNAPPVADSNIQDLLAMRRALATVATAQEIDFFNRLKDSTFSIERVADDFRMSMRASEAMVAVLASVNLIESTGNGLYRLSEEAKTFLVKESDFYRGPMMDVADPVFIQHRDAFANDNKPVDPFAVNIEGLKPEVVESFIARMHMITLPTAAALGRQTVFGRINKLLDVGGGSGSLAVGVATHNSSIAVTLLDLEPVCRIARRNVEEYGLSSKIETLVGSMFEPLPKGFDGILFGNIFHDWGLDTCKKLALNAFEALEPGGYICLHEMVLDETKTGPLAIAAFSVGMLVHELGKQFTKSELDELLMSVGFVDVEMMSSFGHYSLVTARKPVS